MESPLYCYLTGTLSNRFTTMIRRLVDVYYLTIDNYKLVQCLGEAYIRWQLVL